jgi:WD40 repeat protein
MWNLVSGEQVYRIDGVELRAVPSLSGGKRYLALPYEGGVQLIASDTGESLGRIETENQIPGVSFSPHGDRLAISTTRRMRLWDLPTATLSADFECRGGLGNKSPTWIDFDLILSGSGTLLSAFRGLPIWKYDIAATDVRRLGSHTVMLRRHPTSELSIMSLPHSQAIEAMEFIDNRPADIQKDKWRAMGRSRWSLNGWVDRDVQISSNPSMQR